MKELRKSTITLRATESEKEMFLEAKERYNKKSLIDLFKELLEADESLSTNKGDTK
ncbi:MAG: hypothetical protein ACRC5T_12460 [Cetobacterium sp.]